MKKLQLMKKIFIVLVISLLLSLIAVTNIFASVTIEPTDDQYLELRAVEVKEIEGQNKQVTMELWGNNVEFKRI